MSLLSLLTSVMDTSTVVLFVAVFVLSFWWLLSTRRPPGLPPGPGLRLPILGHVHLLNPDLRKTFAEWRKVYGDVFSFYQGRQLVVVFSGYETIREALVKNADCFAVRPKSYWADVCYKNMGISGASGVQNKEQRIISLEILGKLGMGKNWLQVHIREEITDLLKAIESYKGQETDLSNLIHVSFSNNICGILFGERFAYDDPMFLAWLKAIEENLYYAFQIEAMRFLPGLEHIPTDPFRWHKTLEQYKFIEDTMLKPRIQAHIEAYNKGDDYTDFIGGYIQEIFRQKEKGIHTDGSPYRKVRRVIGTDRAPNMNDRPEMTYVEAFIRETLRFWVNAPLVPHGVAYDTKFKGFFIPQGTLVFPNFESVLHDPAAWGDPENFRPERFIGPDGKLVKPDEFVPFALGRRECLGKRLAEMELFLYITSLIQRFKFLPPENGQLPPTETDLGIVVSNRPFKLRAIPRF
ncbi:hypothetical protein BaRGS_00028088 [Batillaria attramentaria]|uniref:Cytochrome P450 n=1 Tax=Batillaria attramentaria TaxID=370345 RepID=A0ABD0K140_9CAEN